MSGNPLPAVGIGRFARGRNAPFAALVVDGAAYPLTQAPRGDTLAIFDIWDDIWPELAQRVEAIRAGAETGMALGDLDVLPPVVPRQILCAGANYRRHVIDIMTDHSAGSESGLDSAERRRRAIALMDHRAAAGAPFAFVKAASALAGAFDTLVVPTDSAQTDWELELAVVIGRPARRVPRDQALRHVAGYTIANDISARDHIARPDIPGMGLDFLAGKSCPGFLPLGPLVVPAPLIADPQDMRLTLRLNDMIMQDESTADMIFNVARLIEFVSTHILLLPGDVICTGSPAGNGTHFNRFLRDGDVMRGAIAGLGAQVVPCTAEQVAAGAVLHRPFVPL
ncbi:fumarylacetoacetate hydrolase family protein [Sphingomonas sp. CL5.1]|uniref:fumarylacetoacetate hydrolase family protein n=1 Tax=Sphingomonas sp. CL5.1 TaxID=2653203 RepID=UPI001581897C|nr:fumarylacetoacetate hydrolase family protein [Sphingomonas sp. CL5.1]QKR99317.1 fumarylacetoacetate hydrolase family protein [Sphingomonas sp. CL5.1]